MVIAAEADIDTADTTVETAVILPFRSVGPAAHSRMAAVSMVDQLLVTDMGCRSRLSCQSTAAFPATDMVVASDMVAAAAVAAEVSSSDGNFVLLKIKRTEKPADIPVAFFNFRFLTLNFDFHYRSRQNCEIAQRSRRADGILSFTLR